MVVSSVNISSVPELPEVPPKVAGEKPAATNFPPTEPPQTVAFLEQGGGGKPNVFAAVFRMLATAGIVSIKAAEQVFDGIMDARQAISSSRAAMEREPHVPFVGEDGRVRVFDDQGISRVIYEPGTMTTGDGGGNGPIDRPRRTGGSGDENEEPDNEEAPNTQRGIDNQRAWAFRVVGFILSAQASARDIGRLLATVSELGDKIDPENARKIFTAAVEKLANLNGSEAYSFENAVDYVLGMYGLDETMRPFVEIALSKELELARRTGESGVEIRTIIASLHFDDIAQARLELRIMDAITGADPQGDDAYDVAKMRQFARASHYFFLDSTLAFMREHGDLEIRRESPGSEGGQPEVEITRVGNFISPTDKFIFDAAVLKQFRAGNTPQSWGVGENSELLKLVTIDADRERRNLGLEQATTQVQNRILADFAEAGRNSTAVRLGHAEIDTSMVGSLETYFAPANQAALRFADTPNNMMVPEFTVLAKLTKTNGSTYFAALKLDAEQFIKTVRAGHDSRVRRGIESESADLPVAFNRPGWQVEIISVPGIEQDDLKRVEVPETWPRLPGWEEAEPY